MGVYIGGIEPRATVVDSGNLQIEGARGVIALEVGGRTYAYVAGLIGDGISSFELRPTGGLVRPINISDDATLELSGAVGFTTATVGATSYLYVNGFSDNGISAFRVNANGTLTNVDNIDDPASGSQLQIDGPRGQMSTAKVGAASFLVATGYDDDGVSVFRVGANGALTNTHNLDDGDNALFTLNNARDSTAAVVGTSTFVFVAGYNDDGVSVFQLGANGVLSFRDRVVDTESAALQLDGAYGVETVTVGSRTYLVTSGEEDDGLSVFRVGNSGQLTNVFNVQDTNRLGLDSPRGMESFTLEGEKFISVSAATDRALSVYHVGSGGQLTEVTKIFDNPNLALNGTRYNDFVMVGGQPMLLGTGQGDKGVSTFEIGGGDDVVRGGATNDLLLGFDGNDVLRGGGGNDRLKGGRGSDDLIGGGGRDVLMADQGRDEFVFNKTKHSAAGVKRDVVDGFAAKDRFVLSKIDADTATAGNQAFTLDTDGVFSAGEIQVQTVAKGTLLLMNVDADIQAEMSVLIRGYKGAINDADFIF